MRRRSFTLIELLVVITVTSILAGMLLPALKRAREAVTSTLCISNERQMLIGLYGYCGDNDGFLPHRKSAYQMATFNQRIVNGSKLHSQMATTSWYPRTNATPYSFMLVPKYWDQNLLACPARPDLLDHFPNIAFRIKKLPLNLAHNVDVSAFMPDGASHFYMSYAVRLRMDNHPTYSAFRLGKKPAACLILDLSAYQNTNWPGDITDAPRAGPFPQNAPKLGYAPSFSWHRFNVKWEFDAVSGHEDGSVMVQPAVVRKQGLTDAQCRLFAGFDRNCEYTGAFYNFLR